MNQVPEEKKVALTKTFAIVGFIAIILFAVWLAVQVVSVMPSAFRSLASLADSVYSYRPTGELIIAAPKEIVNSGEQFTISWNKGNEQHSYYFTHRCTEGVAVDIILVGKNTAVACDTNVDLGNINTLSLTLTSEKKRFTDVEYTIGFKKDESESSADAKVTVLNASIPASVVLGETTDTDAEPTAPTVPAPTVTPKPVVTPTPTVREEVIYAIPVSDPKGFSDLAVTYIGVGELSDSKIFTKTGTINLGKTGAFQFEVKNVGTKTSDTWSYAAVLPASIEYTSSEQKALKPNERAVITIGFDGLTKAGIEKFGVSVVLKNDTNTKNNSFVSAVSVR